MASDLYPKVYLYKRIVQAKLFIDNQYAETIDLNNIADEAYFSKFHFIRLFKTIYGKTPHQYLTHVRLEKAKQLLQTGMSIVSVCYAVGFESITTFSGLFKRTVGLTAAAYQHQHQKRQQEIQDIPLKFIPHCFAAANGWNRKPQF